MMERNRCGNCPPRQANLDGPRARRTAAHRSPYDVPRGTRPGRTRRPRVTCVPHDQPRQVPDDGQPTPTTSSLP